MFLVFPELLSLHEDGLLHRIVFECNKNDQVGLSRTRTRT